MKKKTVLTALFLVCLSATLLPQLAAQLKSEQNVSQGNTVELKELQADNDTLLLNESWHVSGMVKLDWAKVPWHTIKFTNPKQPGFIVDSDNTLLDLNGHTVTFGVTLGPGLDGVEVEGKKGVTIKNGTIINFQYGIWVEGSGKIDVMYNSVTESEKNGIWVSNSSEVNLAFNNISASGDKGIRIEGNSFDVTILNTQVSGSGYDGISIVGNSFDVTILNTQVSGSGDVGIAIYENSSEVSILNSTITGSDHEGIHIVNSNRNMVGCNEISNNNDRGIYLYNSNNNTICNNTVMNNQPGAIYMEMANWNIFYHNNLPGQQDVECVKSKGTWDIDYGMEETTAGDVGYGGNYWDEYDGVDVFSGKNKDIPGSDGIGDAAYKIDEDNQDKYPLMKPWGSMLVNFNLTCIVSGGEKTRSVAVFSNSSIAGFNFNKTERVMSFTAYNGTFCKVIIPKETLDGSFLIMTNDVPTACVVYWDGTHHFINFSLTTNSCNVKIKGEIAIRGDLNGDGKVNIQDISIAAKNYGKGT